MDIITKSEAETVALAQKTAQKLRGGDVLALYGDLGSGKTVFAKGVAKGLGIDNEITSPTFVIQKQYNIDKSGKLKFVHIDCYRLEGRNDFFALGFDEVIGERDTIVVVEWPEKIEKILPKKTKKIFFQYFDQKRRKIVA